MTRTILIIAGETSGDKHAAHLVESMKRKEDVRVIGIGGDKMKAAGVELIHHVKEMSVMGFSEIISKLPFFRKVRRDLLKVVQDEKPSTVILVDYPGFNLRFAESSKKSGLKVVYFISPQIWAWGKNRMKKIRRTVDLMLTIFKFEEEMYKSGKVEAHFIGHPLLDEIKIPTEAEVKTFRDQYASNSAKFLALLPGSRLQEIKRILPTMLESVKVLREELSNERAALEAVVGCAPGIGHNVYREIMRKAGVEVHLSDEVDLLMSSSHAGMVTSGTATLESALHNLPIVVVYKTSMFTYLIGKLLIKLDSISLVNIVGQQKIVEELVQNDFVPQKAARIVREILMDSQVADGIRRKYAELRKILGDPGASDRAAELVLRMI
jgi:lipid-A-disaccharide synthase